MNVESPAAPELPNIDLSEIVVSRTMGAYAVYLSAIQNHQGRLGIQDINPVVEYAQQVGHDLPIKAKEANNAGELQTVGLLSHFGRHLPTIITSKLLESVVDTSGQAWVPHYVFTANGGSGVLIPASAPRMADGQELYMAFGEKVPDEKGYLRPHPLSQAPVSKALYGATPTVVATKLHHATRLSLKVDPNELLTKSMLDKQTTLARAPWLGASPKNDELLRWKAQEGYKLPPLIMEIYQAAKGRTILAARQAFATAVEKDDLMAAYEQLVNFGDYLAEVDARAPHAEIGTFIAKLCEEGLDELAVSAVDRYHAPLHGYKHPNHFAREGALYARIALWKTAKEKNSLEILEVCNYALKAYEQAFTHAAIDTDVVHAWYEQYDEIKQLREALERTSGVVSFPSTSHAITFEAA